MRSYEDSLQRLGINTVDLLVIHDLDLMHMTPAQAEMHMGVLVTSGASLRSVLNHKQYRANIKHAHVSILHESHGHTFLHSRCVTNKQDAIGVHQQFFLSLLLRLIRPGTQCSSCFSRVFVLFTFFKLFMQVFFITTVNAHRHFSRVAQILAAPRRRGS